MSHIKVKFGTLASKTSNSNSEVKESKEVKVSKELTSQQKEILAEVEAFNKKLDSVSNLKIKSFIGRFSNLIEDDIKKANYNHYEIDREAIDMGKQLLASVQSNPLIASLIYSMISSLQNV